MLSWKSTTCSAVALGIYMTGSAAFADVTPQQVWGDWKAYLAGFGYELSSSEAMSGSTLTVSDIAMTMELPESEGDFSMKIGEMSFVDNGDGTVSVTIPPVMPMTVNVAPTTGQAIDLALDYRTKGFVMNVSGDPDRMAYNYTAAQVQMALGELAVDGQVVNIGHANMTMANLTGTTIMTSGNLRRSDQKMSTGAVTYDVAFTDPETGGDFAAKGNLGGMSFAGTGSFPIAMDTTDMAAMLAAGFAFDGGFSYQNGTSEVNVNDAGQTVQFNSNTTDGTLTVAMDDDGLAYSGKANGTNVKIAGSQVPFPVEFALGETGFDLKMPVSKSDEEQDFSFALSLADFTMSDMIWGIFDPGSQLPRDPATVAFDLAGKAKLFFDLMDPEQMQEVDAGQAAPGELNALDLNSLTVRAAGAELTGKGGFTFDNTNLEAFDGMPAPTGAIDLKLQGGNGLLDKLVAMGLLPEDQAMGARMMMGLFAVPGQGEDTLTSRIEVNDEGHVLANGQRLK